MDALKNKPFRKLFFYISAFFVVLLFWILFADAILSKIGRFPVLDQPLTKADAVVVLFTGVDYYPRLIQAAQIYTEGYVKKVVIDGNRKSKILRQIEKDGFSPCCHWAEDYSQILQLYGVQRSDIISISAEDAFDTISEAEAVGKRLLDRNFKRIIVTTSKFHTRRANFIWRTFFSGKLSVTTVAAQLDPYNPYGWWKEGRQIRWVMAEYGAWGYYLWQYFSGKTKLSHD